MSLLLTGKLEIILEDDEIYSPTTEASNIVKELWAQKLKVLPNSNLYELHDDVVPNTMEELMHWACVTRNGRGGDRRQRYALVYILPMSVGEIQPRIRVSIKLQGVVGRLNISTGGNWTG